MKAAHFYHSRCVSEHVFTVANILDFLKKQGTLARTCITILSSHCLSRQNLIPCDMASKQVQRPTKWDWAEYTTFPYIQLCPVLSYAVLCPLFAPVVFETCCPRYFLQIFFQADLFLLALWRHASV